MLFNLDKQLLLYLVNNSVIIGYNYNQKSIYFRELKGEFIELVSNLKQALLKRFKIVEI